MARLAGARALVADLEVGIPGALDIDSDIGADVGVELPRAVDVNGRAAIPVEFVAAPQSDELQDELDDDQRAADAGRDQEEGSHGRLSHPAPRRRGARRIPIPERALIVSLCRS